MIKLLGAIKKYFDSKKINQMEIWGFDRSYYKQNNPDVAIEGIDPYRHYFEHGWKEGRDPSSYFSSAGYLEANPDVAASQLNPLQHFLEHGIVEGRTGWQKKHPEQSDALAVAEISELKAQVKKLQHLMINFRDQISGNISVNPRCGTLFVDISELVLRDWQTGIQRVVKSILSELLRDPPNGMRVVPVCGHADDPHVGYRSAGKFAQRLFEWTDDQFADEIIQPRCGDIFLGLDLAPTLIPTMHQAGIYSEWRSRGVKIYFVVYDLLPLVRPEFFALGTEEQFVNWVTSIRQCADGVLCISRAVAEDFRNYIASSIDQASNKLAIDYFHLASSSLSETITLGDISTSENQKIKVSDEPYVLMVGTLEPRKGHMQILDAFDRIWEQGAVTCLVIIGRKGWLAEDLISRIVHHPLSGKKLFWYSDVDDLDMEYYYSNSIGLIAASYAEGFGLPLIEAAKRDVPILARDIPVFREVAGPHATYFNRLGEFLLQDIKNWLSALTEKTAIRSGGMPVLTWSQSTDRLKSIIMAQH